jgi:hypothetical protein
VRRNARALFGRVARELDRLMVAHGKPTTIVSDNGTCIAAASISTATSSTRCATRSSAGFQLAAPRQDFIPGIITRVT